MRRLVTVCLRNYSLVADDFGKREVMYRSVEDLRLEMNNVALALQELECSVITISTGPDDGAPNSVFRGEDWELHLDPDRSVVGVVLAIGEVEEDSLRELLSKSVESVVLVAAGEARALWPYGRDWSKVLRSWKLSDDGTAGESVTG